MNRNAIIKYLQEYSPKYKINYDANIYFYLKPLELNAFSRKYNHIIYRDYLKEPIFSKYTISDDVLFFCDLSEVNSLEYLTYLQNICFDNYIMNLKVLMNDSYPVIRSYGREDRYLEDKYSDISDISLSIYNESINSLKNIILSSKIIKSSENRVKICYKSRIKGIIQITINKSNIYLFLIKTYTNDLYIIDGWNNVVLFDQNNNYYKQMLLNKFLEENIKFKYKEKDNKNKIIFSNYQLTIDNYRLKLYLREEINILRISYVYINDREVGYPATIKPNICA